MATKPTRYQPGALIPFVLLHAASLAAFFVPFRASLLLWLAQQSPLFDGELPAGPSLVGD